MRPPPKIVPRSLADYFEVLTKAVFQSGIKWDVVAGKWEAMRQAFDGFDPAAVARFSPSDVDRLMEDPKIIRNRRKIEATVDNAVEIVALDAEHGGFDRYLQSHGGFEETSADLRRRFRFLGELGVYYFLSVVGEDVPSHEEWSAARGQRGGRRRPPSDGQTKAPM